MGKKKGLTTAEIEQVKVLSAAGFTDHAISKELNRSPKTITRALSKPETQREVKVIRLDLASKFEGLANELIDSITPEDIKKLSAYQRTLSSGIAVDKCRLLRNESTANIGVDLIEQAWRTQDDLATIDRQLADLRQGAITVNEEGGETGEGIFIGESEKTPAIDSTPSKQ